MRTSPQALFGFGGRDEEKEKEKQEQMRAQQEVLKRRKTNSWQAGVKDRRAKASRCVGLGRSDVRSADGLTRSPFWTFTAADT